LQGEGWLQKAQYLADCIWQTGTPMKMSKKIMLGTKKIAEIELKNLANRLTL
jgi:hypothetical protein